VVVWVNAYPGTREEVILVVAAPLDEVSRRSELADFLRKRREALKPEDVGLPNGGRRRTPGLRREEVAALAGVGTTWYTWLEQGRDVRASQQVLESLAEALRMNAAEHSHLMLLGRGDEITPVQPRSETLEPTIQRLVENLGPSPACIIGRRWDYLAWNRAFSVVFCNPMKYPEGRRNQLWSMFMDPVRRARSTDWETGARAALARFRADNARHLGDPDFEELIEDLREQRGVPVLVEASRGRPQRHGHQGTQAPGAGQAVVRARGLQTRGEPRAAADPLLAAAEVQHA
jgi:transcriptional regulator with XRE-family HTH domain